MVSVRENLSAVYWKKVCPAKCELWAWSRGSRGHSRVWRDLVVHAPCLQNPHNPKTFTPQSHHALTGSRSALCLNLSWCWLIQQKPRFRGFCQKFSMVSLPFRTLSHDPCVSLNCFLYLVHSNMAAGSSTNHVPNPHLGCSQPVHLICSM